MKVKIDWQPGNPIRIEVKDEKTGYIEVKAIDQQLKGTKEVREAIIEAVAQCNRDLRSRFAQEAMTRKAIEQAKKELQIG